MNEQELKNDFLNNSGFTAEELEGLSKEDLNTAFEWYLAFLPDSNSTDEKE